LKEKGMNALKKLFRLFMFLVTAVCFSQRTIPMELELLNKKSVPYVTVEKLKSNPSYILLDAREAREYKVSHIENAVFVGFNTFDDKKLLRLVPDKNATIVVYCSVGVRSEIIGEKLQKLGYKNVLNLYGGIFDWKNSGGEVLNSKGVETDSVHTYDKNWSQYLKKGIKVYAK
jgi:rhodanese-related sulfurtransferase